jgi:hypothetical protein
MPGKVGSEGLRNGHGPTTGAGLRCFPHQTLTGQLDQLRCDVNAATVLLHITPAKTGDLAPPQGAHGSNEDEGAQRRTRHPVSQLKPAPL